MKIKTTPGLANTVFVFCLMAVLLSCTPKQGVYKNGEIPSGTSSKLHDLNTELLSALKDDHPEHLENLVSKELIDNRAERISLATQINIQVKKADYSLLSEYYIVNRYLNGKDTIRERKQGINNFDLTIYDAAQEIYVALFTPKTAMQKFLITAIYYKYDYGWKVGRLEMNPYAENGRTAPELMQQAKEQLKNGHWLDASNTASYAINCLRPYTNWKYTNEDAIYHFNGDALSVLISHYKLPIPITDIATHPRIWRVRIERNSEGSFPNINYISTIKLTDTMALKKENEAIGKVIGKVFNGIDKDKKYIYYTIYNETSKGVPFRDHYDLRQTLN